MLNWKYFVVTTLACSALFAQIEFNKKDVLKGKIVLKDKTDKDMEITQDSKLEVTLTSTATIDNLILNSQYQVVLKIGDQEVVYNVEPTKNADKDNRLDYVGKKEDNKQTLGIQCNVEPTKLEAPSSVNYEKGFVACVKSNSSCRSYALHTEKEFKYGETQICIGKREVELSKENAKQIDVITCKLADDWTDRATNAKNSVMFSFKRTSDSMEKHIKIAASECK
ncbi:MAG: hypothetical protein JNL11_18555 [Bdellovibrionaceae bacterium]|nr:hypothetical protein [Pseudobdellovibrionaceae bacterium]